MAVATSFSSGCCLGLEKGRQRQTEDYTLLHKRQTETDRDRQKIILYYTRERETDSDRQTEDYTLLHKRETDRQTETDRQRQRLSLCWCNYCEVIKQRQADII